MYTDVFPNFFGFLDCAWFVDVVEPLCNGFVGTIWKYKARFVCVIGNVGPKPPVEGAFRRGFFALFQVFCFDTTKDGSDCADFSSKRG